MILKVQKRPDLIFIRISILQIQMHCQQLSVELLFYKYNLTNALSKVVIRIFF